MTASLSPHFRARWAFAALVLGGSLAACGGGGGDSAVAAGAPPAGSPPAGSPPAGSPPPGPAAQPPAPTPAPPLATLNLPACAATGVSGGIDYQVGSGVASSNGTTYTELNQVPWESLKAGDSVRLFYRTAAYKGKFAITGTGSDTAPIRICGVRGTGNARPVIDANGAVTRTATAYQNSISADPAFRRQLEAQSVIFLRSGPSDSRSFPKNVQIFGLNIVRGHPSYGFTDSTGTAVTYESFGACINVNRGQDILIADNEISDCSQAIYTLSKDDYITSGDPNNTKYTVTKNIRIAGNYMWGNGIVNNDQEHTTYTASQGITIEFNRYGPPRSGAGGNSIKDRSVGTVIRYNRIEEGARSMDLVEAEDFYQTALGDVAYRTTYVYGNQIQKSGNSGSFIHYGGDHQGVNNPVCGSVNYGECLFRQGTLYFFNNTIYATGTSAAIFQLSTTLETAEVWNNAIHFADTVASGWRSMRTDQEVAAPYVSGGKLNLHKNWVTTGWADSDIYHPILGTLSGLLNVITGATAPFDLTTMVPLAGSGLVDAGLAWPFSTVTAVPVTFQLNSAFQGTARSVNGSAIDLGAVER